MPDTPLPHGYHSISPLLVVRDAARAIDWYQQALGAREVTRLAGPDGKIAHAEMRVGDSLVMLAEERPEWGNKSPASLGGSPVVLHLYVGDVDALAQRAVEGGAKILVPVADQFYGDRSGRLEDPFGHLWIISTRKEELSLEEVNCRFQAMMKTSSST